MKKIYICADTYLHFEVIEILPLEFVLGMGSESDLSSLHDNDVSCYCSGVYFSKGSSLEVDCGVEEGEGGICWIEIAEEEGGDSLGLFFLDLDGRLPD